MTEEKWTPPRKIGIFSVGDRVMVRKSDRSIHAGKTYYIREFASNCTAALSSEWFGGTRTHPLALYRLRLIPDASCASLSSLYDAIEEAFRDQCLEGKPFTIEVDPATRNVYLIQG